MSPDLAHHAELALIRLAELQTEAEQASAAYLAFHGPTLSVEYERLLKLSVATALRLDTAREEYRRKGEVSI